MKIKERFDEPPSKINKNSSELCVSRSGDLDSIIFGCPPLLAGSNNFRSLVMLGNNRRVGLLETNRADK